jgi:hypothetical protein
MYWKKKLRVGQMECCISRIYLANMSTVISGYISMGDIGYEVMLVFAVSTV